VYYRNVFYTVLTHGPTASRGDRPTNMLTTTKMRLQHHVQ
jgi:hypothetical protein